MYSLVTMEDTIRIPAEYIRKDRKLEDHIDELAHAAHSCVGVGAVASAICGVCAGRAHVRADHRIQ